MSKNQEDFLTCLETILLIVPFNNNMAHKPRVKFGSQMRVFMTSFIHKCEFSAVMSHVDGGHVGRL